MRMVDLDIANAMMCLKIDRGEAGRHIERIVEAENLGIGYELEYKIAFSLGYEKRVHVCVEALVDWFDPHEYNVESF